MKTKNIFYVLLLLTVGLSLLSSCSHNKTKTENILAVSNQPRTRLLFDFGWYFHRGDLANGQNAMPDASSWKPVNLPHDWSIKDLPGTNTPLDSNAIGGINTGYFV